MGTLRVKQAARMKPSQLFAFLIVASFLFSAISACCCSCYSSCNCNAFCCECHTHDGGWCYWDGEWSDSGPCYAYYDENCNALTDFLKADKDQNGFVFPSEFDSDLIEFDSNL